MLKLVYCVMLVHIKEPQGGKFSEPSNTASHNRIVVLGR